MKFQFSSVSDFLQMNGHGGYVWACYGVTFLVLLILVGQPVWARAQFIKEQKALAKRQSVQKQSESV